MRHHTQSTKPNLGTKLGGVLLCATLLLSGLSANAATDAHETPTNKHTSAIRAAMTVLDEFMITFNRRDMPAWAETLNYPHVRFASNEVKVWSDIHEFMAEPPFTLLANIGWDHSHWRSRDVVMASATKVHIATLFERFNAANESIGVYQSLYIVTRVNGQWGIQSRSSLAP